LQPSLRGRRHGSVEITGAGSKTDGGACTKPYPYEPTVDTSGTTVRAHAHVRTPTRTREQLIIWTVRGIASVAPEASAGATLVWMSCECTSMPTAATQLTCAYDSLTEDLCWLVVTVRHRELDETGHDFAADEIAIAQGISDGTTGGGGCYAYGICKLGVYRTFGEAKRALDMAGEAIYQRRAREHKASTHLPTYPRAKVYNAGLTWCPEAIQHAVQGARHRIHRAWCPNSDNVDLQTLVESTGHSAQMLLLEGTLAQVFLCNVRGHLEEITIDAEDPSPEEKPELWRHTLAVRGGKLFDMYNPRGLGVEHLRLAGNEIGPGAYMRKL
jgi:hypothetical protein